MPPCLRGTGIGTGERLCDRHRVEHYEGCDSIRVLQRQSVGHVAAEVVSDGSEPVVPELVHQGDYVIGPSRVWRPGRGPCVALVLSTVRSRAGQDGQP